jgi:hypothetical protein
MTAATGQAAGTAPDLDDCTHAQLTVALYFSHFEPSDLRPHPHVRSPRALVTAFAAVALAQLTATDLDRLSTDLARPDPPCTNPVRLAACRRAATLIVASPSVGVTDGRRPGCVTGDVSALVGSVTA